MSTRATALFGIDVPVMLGAFGGVSSVALVAAVSEGGGLGSYGLYGYGAERIRETTAAIRVATSRPFALNLWLPYIAPGEADVSAEGFAEHAELLRPYFEELGLPLPEQPESYLPPFEEQLDAVFEARPAVLSLVFGAPSAALIDRARALGIVVVGTATTVEEALALETAGVDAVVASGMEAGGHRVSFLRPAEESLVGTFALVPRIVDAVSVPVIAAGGIADGRGLAAATMLGADAVQVGTAFLATEESAAVEPYREILRSAAASETVLTRAPSGRLARGIPNRLTRELADAAIAPFPVQNWLTGRFRPAAAERGVTDLMSLWAGQAAPLLRHHRASDVLTTMVADAERLLGRSLRD